MQTKNTAGGSGDANIKTDTSNVLCCTKKLELENCFKGDSHVICLPSFSLLLDCKKIFVLSLTKR
jgi:hypothetical protein